MNGTAEAVLAFLDEMGIGYRTAEHPPAFTMADCARVDAALGALTVKNLFLTTKHTGRFCLCLTRPGARFRSADVSKQAGSSRLGFASEAALMEKLRCRAGSASPLGLMFDSARGVGLIVDRALRDVPVLAFHPCDNTMSVAMASEDFFGVFLPGVGVAPVWVEIRDFMDDGEQNGHGCASKR